MSETDLAVYARHVSYREPNEFIIAVDSGNKKVLGAQISTWPVNTGTVGDIVFECAELI